MMKIFVAIIVILFASSVIFRDEIRGFVYKENSSDSKDKRASGDTSSMNASPEIIIKEKWDLPSELKEVSGIAYMGEERFACVQDEKGSVYIYNIGTKKIEKEIPFASPGDFEGITLKDQTAYVVRADGVLFEVPLDGDKSSVKEYKTPLTVDHNIEGLCYDKSNDRLLLGIKDNEPTTKDYKGIYAFDLKSKSMDKSPVFKVDMKHELLNQSTGKKSKPVMPSAIGIHPVTGDLLITDGPQSRLLVMDKNGEIKSLFNLGKQFEQPEGISFSEDGKIYISNEGTKQPGNIIEVEIK